MERGVTLGVAHAFDFHARLRPLLRDVAAARLALSRGIDLDSPAGRAALGEEAWELLRPDRPAPDDRFGPGVPAERLRALVDSAGDSLRWPSAGSHPSPRASSTRSSAPSSASATRSSSSCWACSPTATS